MKEQRLTVAAVLAMVRALAEARVRNGETTVRGLALRAGVSQPYLHNVMKGERQMTPDLADRLLREFEMGVAELIATAPAPGIKRIGPSSERPAVVQPVRPARASR